MDKRFLIILAVLFVGFFGFIMFQKNKDSSNSTGQRSQNIYGKADSQVTLTEFVDFQCEACYAYYPHVKAVKEKYKDQVKFEVRNFPITSSHQFSMQAARSAEAAARQGKFWEMHDLIFQGQKQWEQMSDPQPTFDKYAETIGLDMAKYQADRASADVASVINKDLADVQTLGGTGTPTFLLNGEKIESPGPSVEALSKVIEEALNKAGITPKPAPVQATSGQPASGGATQPSSGNGGLAPGETQEQHDQESQQGAPSQ